MANRRLILALLIGYVVSACGTTTPSTTPPASQALTQASPAVTTSATTPSATPEAVAAATVTPETTPAPAASPVPEATPVPTPEPWKSFTSKRYRYAVKYPADWFVTNGSTKLADQIDDYVSHYVYLSRDTVSGAISIGLTVTHDKATFKSHYKAKLLSSKKVTVNGWPGRLLTFDGSENGRKLFIQHLILGKGKVGYFVDMFSDRGQATADTALFKQIYKTFKPKS